MSQAGPNGAVPRTVAAALRARLLGHYYYGVIGNATRLGALTGKVCNASGFGNSTAGAGAAATTGQDLMKCGRVGACRLLE